MTVKYDKNNQASNLNTRRNLISIISPIVAFAGAAVTILLYFRLKDERVSNDALQEVCESLVSENIALSEYNIALLEKNNSVDPSLLSKYEFVLIDLLSQQIGQSISEIKNPDSKKSFQELYLEFSKKVHNLKDPSTLVAGEAKPNTNAVINLGIKILKSSEEIKNNTAHKPDCAEMSYIEKAFKGFEIGVEAPNR